MVASDFCYILGLFSGVVILVSFSFAVAFAIVYSVIHYYKDNIKK